MRTILAFAAIIAVANPAVAATRNFGITGFTKVRVDGPFKVNVATDVAPYARASGSPAALDRLAIDVRGDTLVVHSSAESWGGYPGRDPGPVEINVGTHELSQAWLNGAGSLAIDRAKGLTFGLSVQGSGVAQIARVSADELDLNLVGTASARVGGRTRKLVAIIRGISTLDASSLTARDATLGAEGAATVDVQVTNTASVDSSGPATIRFSGQPSCSIKAGGSASITGCR